MQDVGSFNEESVTEIFSLLFGHYNKEDILAHFESGTVWAENESNMTKMLPANKKTLREIVQKQISKLKGDSAADGALI